MQGLEFDGMSWCVNINERESDDYCKSRGMYVLELDGTLWKEHCQIRVIGQDTSGRRGAMNDHGVIAIEYKGLNPKHMNIHVRGGYKECALAYEGSDEQLRRHLAIPVTMFIQDGLRPKVGEAINVFV